MKCICAKEKCIIYISMDCQHIYKVNIHIEYV